MDLSRREFVETSIGLCACAVLGQGCARYSDAPEIPTSAVSPAPHQLRISLYAVPSLGKPGGSAKFYGPDQVGPLIVVRIDATRYAATALKCTHGGAELEYEPTAQRLRCVSFGHSQFGLDGKLLEGPADRPIRRFPTRLEGNTLVIEV